MRFPDLKRLVFKRPSLLVTLWVAFVLFVMAGIFIAPGVSHDVVIARKVVPITIPTPTPKKEIVEKTFLLQQNAQPFQPGNNFPTISIVIQKLGLNEERFAWVEKNLPKEISLGIFPQTSPENIFSARQKGREMLLMVPMEPSNYPYNDPGPNLLLTNLNPEQNTERLYAFLSDQKTYVGILPFMGDAFLHDPGSIDTLTSWLGRTGYAFINPLDHSPASPSLLAQTASDYGVFTYNEPMIMDSYKSKDDTLRAFSLLEHRAQQDGKAMLLISPSPKNLELLKLWSSTLPEKKISLAPFSNLFLGSVE